ncbi:sodium:solute symporter [Bacteroidaceae bacterium HV4-6-C5C]|nr:sodium:solute symporter [Bacteroidaceae bacterium HV4-6-C5C]
MGNYILAIVAVYLGVILFISYLSGRKNSTNEAFFLANRSTPWYIVAIGMLGDSISGVTFVSVPGMVRDFDMTYMQLVFGFFVGYIVVAYVLLPLYYRLNLVSIYTYLEQRFGYCSYKTGASFFILSKIVGAAAKLYLVILILQSLVFDQMGIPFTVTAVAVVFVIWVYTFRNGMGTIIWTDVLQTVSLLVALGLIIWQVASHINIGWADVMETVRQSGHSRIFVFDDWHSRQNFFKQFLSGVFIVIVMTGLDQNMMQKNLTCRNLKEARKNMLTYGFGFIPMNFLFLTLGILLLTFASRSGITLPAASDNILPMLASKYLGTPVLLCFTVGVVAAAFSNADSALTSLTTSFCVDILGMGHNVEKAKHTRTFVHSAICAVFILVILFINGMQQTNVLNTIYVAVSYTYGPLLGLFSFGLFCNRSVKDRLVPYICILAPLLSYILEWGLKTALNYQVGYEILLFNGAVTFAGLWLIRTADYYKALR